MCCFVILLLSNEMQMSVRRFSAIPHLRVNIKWASRKKYPAAGKTKTKNLGSGTRSGH